MRAPGTPAASANSQDVRLVFTADGYSDALPTIPHPSGSPELRMRGSEFAAPSPPHVVNLSPPCTAAGGAAATSCQRRSGERKREERADPFPWIASPWQLISRTISPSSVRAEGQEGVGAPGLGGDGGMAGEQAGAEKSYRRKIEFRAEGMAPGGGMAGCGGDAGEASSSSVHEALCKARRLLLRGIACSTLVLSALPPLPTASPRDTHDAVTNSKPQP